MVKAQMAVRTARPSDHTSIANLMYFESHVHRHLDWRGALEWLGVPEYWVLEKNNSVVAALACPPDPERVSWLHLFAHSSVVTTSDSWKILWENARVCLAGRGLVVGAITVVDWFSDLLPESGFTVEQRIVVLEHRSLLFQEHPVHPDLLIRPMTENDLSAVTEVDHSGFSLLWRNSSEALRVGLMQAGFATVALINGEIIGYQISTRSSYGVHLARLAVSQPLQGRGIGYLLVQDLLSQCRRAGINRLTVNTQSDNQASLSLYQKIGFELTGESYSVFTCRP